MATTVKQWPDGGSLTIQYDGQGDGEIIVTSDPNTVYEARSMEFTVKTADGSVSITRTIQQAARQHIDISAAVVTAPYVVLVAPMVTSLPLIDTLAAPVALTVKVSSVLRCQVSVPLIAPTTML